VSPAPETFRIGGDLEVGRLGFGAMRLCGPRTRMERENALGVLRRAVELGVNLVDTAHAYVRTRVNERPTPAQVALAWLLHWSPVVLPIPGTASLEHLEENVAASRIELSDGDIAALSR
jgi:aryl-alcohol dehydrogenase-like predicted oxidoreductase